MHRFPRSVYTKGDEPDPRFSLANERTFLAWIRTALAILAAGVALEALEIPEHPVPRAVAALIFIALGLFATVRAWLGWAGSERALREGKALPGLSAGAVIVAGVVVAVVIITVGLFL